MPPKWPPRDSVFIFRSLNFEPPLKFPKIAHFHQKIVKTSNFWPKSTFLIKKPGTYRPAYISNCKFFYQSREHWTITWYEYQWKIMSDHVQVFDIIKINENQWKWTIFDVMLCFPSNLTGFHSIHRNHLIIDGTFITDFMKFRSPQKRMKLISNSE